LHKAALPRLGGTVILAVVVLVVCASIAVSRLVFHDSSFPIRAFLALLGPALLVFAVGLWDDFRPLSPYLKFGVEALAAVWLFLDGFRVQQFQLLFGVHPLKTAVDLMLTVFWVLLITNAFNLLDGLDGLAAGSALFSSMVVFAVSLSVGGKLTSLLTIALAGAIVGFLRYNFNPATIFLGDCGSLTIGFLLSAVSLRGSQKASTAVAVAIPVVSFGLPILDTVLAVIRRFLNRKSLFSADSEHIHHKLLRRGLSQRQAVVLLYAVSAGFALLSLLLLSAQGSAISIVLAVIGFGIFFGLPHLGYHEVDELWRVASRTMQQKSIILNNLAIRRATEELLSAQSLAEVCFTLENAFSRNEFDAFDFTFVPEAPGEAAPVSHAWCKEGYRPRRAGWSMRLDLVSARGRKLGAFSVYRSFRVGSLRTDINCLIADFAPALCAALQRVTEPPAALRMRPAPCSEILPEVSAREAGAVSLQ
jgi:UDP-GlcNAc:undecaprenyl-phosphate GlcNAc-1-phosphate transferase